MTVSIFVIFFPTNHTIEESVTALSTIYNVTIVVFGGLLTYFVFFNHSFSVNSALEKTMEKMNDPPPNVLNSIQENKWDNLTEEAKAVEVMTALTKNILRHTGEGGGSGGGDGEGGDNGGGDEEGGSNGGGDERGGGSGGGGGDGVVNGSGGSGRNRNHLHRICPCFCKRCDYERL